MKHFGSPVWRTVRPSRPRGCSRLPLEPPKAADMGARSGFEQTKKHEIVETNNKCKNAFKSTFVAARRAGRRIITEVTGAFI